MIFPVIMCRCAIWTIRKGEWQKKKKKKNWAFELWCFERFLRLPYTTRISNQSIWKEINFWPLLSQLRHLMRASRWKEWMLLLQNCLTVAAPSRVCSSTSGGSSERLKALCTLSPPIHVLHSPQQHWRPRKGYSGRWRTGMTQGSTGAITSK